MAGETTLTIVGNLVADPELRFTPAGAAVCSFRMASTPRYLDKASNEWKDGEGVFLTVNCWRQMAENVAESLSKGTRVIVQGRLKQRSYETREGEKRTVMEIEADEVGPALSRNTAKVARANRDGGGGGGYGGGGGNSGGGGGGWSGGGGSSSGGGQQSGGNSYSGGGRSAGPANDDPWSSPAPGGFSDEPPF